MSVRSMLGRSNDHDPFLLQIDSIVSSEAVIYARLPSLFPCRAGWAFGAGSSASVNRLLLLQYSPGGVMYM